MSEPTSTTKDIQASDPKCSNQQEHAQRETRDRKRALRVFVSPTERAEIDRRAALAGRSRSDYLRSTGLECELRSRLDHSAVLALVHLNAELGELEQLLNELSGGEAAAVRGPRDRIRAMQEQLATLAGNVA